MDVWTPEISIIVPVYNVEQYLTRCVKSVLNQTFKKFEVILVDDGSTDNSGNLCDALAKQDQRIVVIHQINKGLSEARNSGLEVARGKYISYVDSDDSVSPYFLELLRNSMIAENADMVECSRIDVYNNEVPRLEKELNCFALSYSKEEAMRMLIRNREIYQTVWNKLYKREIIKNLCFPESRLHEDEFFTWKVILNCSKIVKISAPLYFYYHRDGSIMETFSKKRLDFFEARYERHLYIKEKFPHLLIDSKESIELPCIFTMQKILKSNDYELQKECRAKLNNYYKKCKLSNDELHCVSIRKRIWYVLANISLELCAGVRNLLGRQS